MTFQMGEVSQSVYDIAQKQGFSSPVVDSGRPSLPSDITAVSSVDLMNLFVHLTEFTNYAATQEAFAVIDEKHAEAVAADKHNQLMSRADSSDSRSGRVTFQKIQASSDPAYLQLRAKADIASAYRTLLRSMMESLDRDLKVVSREITRRTSSTEHRSNRWSA
jgi:hypothetical protein